MLHALEATKDRGSSISTGGRQINLGNVALAQYHLDEAYFYFAEGLRSSQDYQRQDNIAEANFGLARVHALRGNKSEAIALGQAAREQFVRMGMEQEVTNVDDFLQQIMNGEDQHG